MSQMDEIKALVKDLEKEINETTRKYNKREYDRLYQKEVYSYSGKSRRAWSERRAFLRIILSILKLMVEALADE